ncbi:MAG TPA: hypothetical protein VHC70_03400, partial [Phycisphaerales bacterium]|nr:hypothetical protein [Phycisphaerales bacterium]
TPGPDLAAQPPSTAAQSPSTAAQSPQATSTPTPASTSSPNPQSEIPDPQSLQSLLAQLAPHLEHIAAEIGIDDALAAHGPPIPAPPRQDPPPPAGRNAGAPIREVRVIPAENPRSDPPSDPQEPESASATVPGRSEHWP